MADDRLKILELNIEGFRSLRCIKWRPKDLNVVIGPNGAGKSNLLRFLELIAIATAGKLGLGKYVRSLGGIDALLWDGKADSISFTLKTSPAGQDNGPEHYELQLVRLGKSSSYRIHHELLANYARVLKGEETVPFKFLSRTDKSAVIFDDSERGFVVPPEYLFDEETLLSSTTGPFTNNQLIPIFQKQLAAITVYHDLQVNSDSAIRQPAIVQSETIVRSNGENLIPVLHTLYTGDRDFRDSIKLAMKAAFGDDFEDLVFAPDAADKKIQLRISWRTLKRDPSAADLSDGTLRFLLLLTILASPSPPPVIAIDEPEVGLHPSMLPIIAEYAVQASHRAQVILTTHSPQFLDAFTDTIPTTTVVSWESGETKLQVLSGEELAYWLKEYSLGALFKSGELETMV
jgi:predicted ATPase